MNRRDLLRRTGAAALALGRWFKYCELGAVSPDYPYLVLKGTATAWADLSYQLELMRQVSELARTRRLAVVAVLHDLDQVRRDFPNALLLARELVDELEHLV